MKSSSAHFWRSLAEFSEPGKLRELSGAEFPPGASNFGNFNRREFLKIMGASLALASLPACTRQPVRKIVPYVKQPETLVPGKPMFFATAMPLGGFATGLLAESHEGHPTKIEGNPDHPASLGATNIFHQAAVLDLYDPYRSQTLLNNAQPSTWDAFMAALNDVLRSQAVKNGRGLRILTETISSPTLNFQLQSLLKKYPEATWHQFEPVNRDNVHAGALLAFGEIVEAHFHFEKAKIILSLDADFLFAHPNSVRYARDFAEGRRAKFDRPEMNRLYVVESSPTVTGANADHRLPLRAGEMENITRALAEKIGATSAAAAPSLPLEISEWVLAVADDLAAHRGQSLVIAGENQPPAIHALAHSLNNFLGNVGNTVTFSESAVANPIRQTDSMRELIQALSQDQVDALIIFGGNPVFTAPADFHFAENMARAKFQVHLSADVNETSSLCAWHIPQNHFLETWSDARAFDGTTSIVQPLILPLYAGKSAHELLDLMISPPGRSDYEIVREFWRAQNPGDDFESNWRRALHDGLVANTALPAKNVSLRPFELPGPKNNLPILEVTFRPDATIYDGRFANNGWLQELPRPVTKLVWDNAALVSPALAAKENLANGDVVELACEHRVLKIPAWITPGQPENSIALQFGGGRTRVGTVGQNAGSNVFKLRTSAALWFVGGAHLKKTGEKFPLVTTQTQRTVDSEDRQIFREATLNQFFADKNVIQKTSEDPHKNDTLFDPPEFQYAGYRWGMAIDLSACIGCSACTIACQAENNIPIVGKTEVGRGRVLHWIRVDHYFRGPPENPEMFHQPVPCMHCENAPCELVCPVGATLHDHEGLNLQVYNRCVGTRYCSNNCPYKVRRFNFFQYADYENANLKPLWNPNVTVRWRGVMEKCTYCIQRISEARIGSENANRRLRDGEIKTACQQVCPAQAIAFGDLSDPDSRASKLKSHPLNFSMLGELNTRPRTTYLAKLRNPNPQLA
jgi:molybdopterin-containing oxidoreductase family iron-sulfur binding subunit